MKGVIKMTEHEQLSVMQDRFFARRAVELAEELQWQILWKQKSVDYPGAEWNWLEEVFWMLHDIKQLAQSGIPDDERPDFKTLTEYRDKFRMI